MTPPVPALPARSPDFWRSLEERAGTAAFEEQLAREFPAGATLWPTDLNRRDFLKLLGGSLALAGLAGCGQRPREEIVPYVTSPEHALPGVSVFYASAISSEGFGRGILVESHLGRPTKIEGNPDHPESRGATDAMTQAAILGLYDPDRSRAPRQAGALRAWSDFDAEWLGRQRTLVASGGRGLAFLTEPTTSPTTLREVGRILDAFPAAQWYQHTPLARYDLDGSQADYDFAAADVVFSVGSDCLAQHPAALRYSRAFASRRRIENGQTRLNRFYALEATPTLTGTMADFRLPASPARTRVILDALAQAHAAGSAPSEATLTPEESRFAASLLAAWREAHGTAVCIAGPDQDANVQRWARAMNVRLAATARLQTLMDPVRSDADGRAHGELPDLVAAIRRGEVETLLILGSNPGYTAPVDLDFLAELGRVPWSLHLGQHVDETGVACTWHLPESHFLETWGDLRGYDGTVSLQQPLIAPLYPSRSVAELLRLVVEPTGKPAYDLVRETWRGEGSKAEFERAWHQALNAGIIGPELAPTGSRRGPALRTGPQDSGDVPVLDRRDGADRVTLILQPDARLLDGRFANNPWLQELPDSLTHLVWDNAALVSPALAAELEVANGDRIEITHAPARLEAAVLILPGQAADCVTLALGHGRAHAGGVGSGRGFNAYRLRTVAAPWQAAGVTVRKLSGRYPFVTTQEHFAMEGRGTVRLVSADHATTRRHEEQPSLYPSWPRDTYAWGMSIDLGTCTGCSACVVACQAENNIPSVGKEQVARGREMLWLRVDRYFTGDPANPRMLPQPVPCMHCENAPCELVCPVGATVHSSEGLNDMVYNRCVGTRYCSNNCPYKVRRFNFLDFRAPPRSPVHLQENPNVTVRARGVMEKCTYCVQRINAARIDAEKGNRRIRDGEIKTACQQACPVEAIVFGDLNDSSSRVSRRKREPLDYSLLEELNTRPRTTYLARVVAPGALSTPAAMPETGVPTA